MDFSLRCCEIDNDQFVNEKNTNIRFVERTVLLNY